MTPIEQAAKILSSAWKGVAFTGAGISAASGISTYRDTGGLWDRFGSEDIFNVLAEHPDKAHEIIQSFFSALEKARPNPAHLALAKLEEMGHLSAVITQNVDNLHREAGSRSVYELHGNLYRLRCMTCGRKQGLPREALFAMVRPVLNKIDAFSLDALLQAFPRCECGGLTRPDFVSFGEAVQDLTEAKNAARTCDAMLVIGTSGLVSPAAALPRIAKHAGAQLIEINWKESELTPFCDLSIRAQATEALPQILACLMPAKKPRRIPILSFVGDWLRKRKEPLNPKH
jgi:NAD-dependent deacetylase